MKKQTNTQTHKHTNTQTHKFTQKSQQHLQSRNIAHIPYLPVHLRDLVFFEDPPDILSDSSGVLLVNYAKIKCIFHSITQLLASQKSYVLPAFHGNRSDSRGVGSPDLSSPLAVFYTSDVVFVERDEKVLVSLSGAIRPYPSSAL
jgi:hypothetical protein